MRQDLLIRLKFSDLSEDYLKMLIQLAKDEDLNGKGLAVAPAHTGDATSKVLSDTSNGSAYLVARETITICGLPLIPLILEAYDTKLSFELLSRDGATVDRGTRLGKITGPASSLLQAERVMLNFVQFLSGVSTLTRRYVKAMSGSDTRILDTRKTTPGFRMLQKYAVACGNGWNHRLGLFDRVMLKDNHLAADNATGGEALSDLVKRTGIQNPDLAIEVEVDHLDQIEPILLAGADKIMLDNFSLEDTKTAIALIDGRAYTEATGGISLAMLPELCVLGLDFISTGAIVHKSVWKDIGLDWE